MQLKNLVIIANYNQGEEISHFLAEVQKYIDKSSVVVVDDGSTDGSGEIAESLGYKTLFHPINLGIGAAIRTGLLFALDNGFDGVLISSSNGKMVPAEFPSLLTILDEGQFSYVQGSRFMNLGKSENLPLFRRVMIPLLSFFWSVLLGHKMTDLTCGLRAYKTALLRDPRIHLNQAWLNQYELEYYLHIKFLRDLKTKMIEVPVTIRYSHLKPTRLSKIRPITGWWSMARPFVFLILRIKK